MAIEIICLGYSAVRGSKLFKLYDKNWKCLFFWVSCLLLSFLQPSVTCRKKKKHCNSKDSKGDDGGRIEESDEGRRENTGNKEESYKEILLG